MTKNKPRIAAIQYCFTPESNAKAVYDRIRRWIVTAAEYGADFVVFPEFLWLHPVHAQAASRVKAAALVDFAAEHVDRLDAMFAELADECAIHIISGTRVVRGQSGHVQNICRIYLKNGEIYDQHKLHPTPDENAVWNVTGGNRLDVIETDCGRIGVLVCYDSEFPQAAAHLAAQGVDIIFVPFCTDSRNGYCRVRYCSQARAVENQCYVVMAGTCGALPKIENLHLHYAQSLIASPADTGFARDGLAAIAEPCVEQMIYADLDLALLQHARKEGAVRNLADRRTDLYQTVWLGDNLKKA